MAVIYDDVNGAAGSGDGLGELDWDTVESSFGETREEHIKPHTKQNDAKLYHGVFNDTKNYKKIISECWGKRALVTPIAGNRDEYIYNIPCANAGYGGGIYDAGVVMDFVTIITRADTNELITAFPSDGTMGVDSI